MDVLFKYIDTASESSSSEDLENFDSLYCGQACSVISSLEETIKRIDNFLLFERQFFHGEIVRLASDSKHHSGKVVNAEMTVNLETTSGHTLENVSSRSLRRIMSVSEGDYVVLGPWFGRVEKTIERLTILFDDGTKCDLSADDAVNIITAPTDLLDDSVYPFYPGQRIQVESTTVTRFTEWLCGKRKDKKEHGTIVNVDAGVAYVEWLCSAVMNADVGCAAPPSMQDPENLTVLSAFPHASWQLGDWCIVPVERSFMYPFNSSVMSKEKNGPEVLNRCGGVGSSFLQVAVITGTKTKYDVLWQDGSRSLGLASHLLVPVRVVDAHDFWPHTFVLEKGNSDLSQVPDLQRWGVIKNVEPEERTARVKWCKLISDEEEQTEETVSSYELIEHMSYSFQLGETVCKMNSFALKDHVGDDSNGQFLCYFGTVAGYENGYVEVIWASGETSKVAPYEISSVERCKGAFGDENALSENDELSTPLSSREPKDVSNHSHANLDCSDMNSCDECSSEFRSVYSQLPENEADDSESYPQATEVNSGRVPSSIENRKYFKQFDMVNDCSDHHFVKESGMEAQSPQTKRSRLKKINKEWSILDKDLPETIFVRVHEERIDLLRAAIVGADGTPYHDALFFFDIYLPPQYPYEPPMVYYNSGGLRVNPNLYESGKVCLSLLNTWSGSQTEVWNPDSSTILQVLLSLQALVLNDKPYFNEAGYDSQIGKAEGEKNSISYNENAFLVSCKSVLYVLNQPPKNFEELVKEHFSRRCTKILSACEAYMAGAPLDHPFHYKNGGEDTHRPTTSTGFKIMLSKLYSRLVETFAQKGFFRHGSLDSGT